MILLWAFLSIPSFPKHIVCETYLSSILLLLELDLHDEGKKSHAQSSMIHPIIIGYKNGILPEVIVIEHAQLTINENTIMHYPLKADIVYVPSLITLSSYSVV